MLRARSLARLKGAGLRDDAAVGGIADAVAERIA